MRNHLLIGAGVVTAAFLVATNPVIVNAAGTITGADIKNSSLTGKDVKNGSLKSADFTAGQLPAGAQGPAGPQGVAGTPGTPGTTGPQGPAGPVKRVASDVGTVAISGSPLFVFVGDTTTVTVTANQTVMGSVTASLNTTTGTADVSLALCAKATAGNVFIFNGDNHLNLIIDTARKLYAISSVSLPLPAGTYTVGLCAGQNAQAFTGDYVTGFFQVLPAGTASDKAASGNAAR